MDAIQSLELAILVLLTLVWWWMYRPYSKTRPSPPAQRRGGALKLPGPLALPWLGTSWVYTVFGGYTFGEVHTFYAHLAARYGPVCKEEALWNVPVVSLYKRRDIEKVLRCSSKYPIRPPTEAIAHYRRSRPDRYASTGIVNEQGERWHHLRVNLTVDLTSSKTIANYLPELHSIADDFCELLKSMRDPTSCTLRGVEDPASRLGLEAICCLVLGRRMGFLLHGGANNNEPCALQSRLAAAVTNHFRACRDTYYGLPAWKVYPTPAYRKLAQSEQQIYDLVAEIITTASNSEETDDGCSAILRAVLTAQVDPREKTAALVDFIAAGIYTMRNSLVFLLDLIANHPESHQRIRDDDVYLRAAINESFRLRPTAICLARVTQQEVEVTGGYRLPAGSVVLCQTGIACRDSDNFYKADEFIPERWLDDAKQATSSAATFLVIPFGVGRRMCPGRRFVEQSLPVILRRVVQRFDMRALQEMEYRFEFLLAPKGPVNMTFADR